MTLTPLPRYAFTVIDVPQRSVEWFRARCGRLTGSRAADMLATLKSGGEAASRRNLRVQLIVERLTGIPQDDGNGFITPAMQRGIDCEPEAVAAYMVQTGHLVQRSGFLSHNDLMMGCSLDGYIGTSEGILEVKCPNSATHYDYLKRNSVPPEHVPQITHNLTNTGAQWCDFVSYDSRFPAHRQTVIFHVDRDEAAVLAYQRKAIAFLEEVAREVDAFKGFHVLDEVK